MNWKVKKINSDFVILFIRFNICEKITHVIVGDLFCVKAVLHRIVALNIFQFLEVIFENFEEPFIFPMRLVMFL